MNKTLVDQVRECLRPNGMYLVPDDPDEAIATKRGGRIYLTETADGLETKIVRRDGKTIKDVRPADHPGKLALAIRVLNFRARA